MQISGFSFLPTFEELALHLLNSIRELTEITFPLSIAMLPTWYYVSTRSMQILNTWHVNGANWDVPLSMKQTLDFKDLVQK